MTVVKECGTLEDAWMAKNLLENEGIPADILDEALASTAPYLLNSSGIRVAVADEDAAAARQHLGLPPLSETARNRRQTVPGWLVFAIVVTAVISLFVVGVSQNRSGGRSAALKQEYDRNGDGRIDKRIESTSNGNPALVFRDDNYDGRWDTREEYENGERVRSQRDLDLDGTFDSVTIWKNDLPVTTTVTPGGSGFPLIRYDYKNGNPDTRWEDDDRDGAWNTCISYDAMGRETGRKSLR
ncbi:DUF2007 domain-containing protein [Luteolibacter ambystomatis]|uniref:DUF2007 domain-containing protein n=1 Tax=Luteolibacter ambystomatis TaxID=2824561 RepID=A0A975IZ89_9BACT|nr:DUF2007 domain-containing protein [Luteolibacter ambystomatis]QUE50668.1 DUF2007 domain-containing protein [Luteolibacter ambystomatis]